MQRLPATGRNDLLKAIDAQLRPLKPAEAQKAYITIGRQLERRPSASKKTRSRSKSNQRDRVFSL